MKPIDILTGGQHSRTIAAKGCTGCDRTNLPPDEFKDAISAREYAISGMCQTCQNGLWG